VIPHIFTNVFIFFLGVQPKRHLKNGGPFQFFFSLSYFSQ
jgi:hypothetical protein